MNLSDILKLELDEHFDDLPLYVIETGTIRGRSEASPIADGYSTLFFAERVNRYGGHVTSIDLDTQTCALVLDEHKLRHTTVLLENYSVSAMARVLGYEGPQIFDVAFLDSANDAQLVFDEFLIAEHLVKSNGLIIIDDVRMESHTKGESALAKKGDLVWPYIQREGYTWRIHEREGWASYTTGVLIIEPK